MEHFGKIVAFELYPKSSATGSGSSEILWQVISDKEKLLCNRIADAVLSALREPTPEMLAAADDEVGVVIERLKGASSRSQIPDDVMSVAFSRMIDTARNQKRFTPEPGLCVPTH